MPAGIVLARRHIGEAKEQHGPAVPALGSPDIDSIIGRGCRENQMFASSALLKSLWSFNGEMSDEPVKEVLQNHLDRVRICVCGCDCLWFAAGK
jgi:hypothetical protein